MAGQMRPQTSALPGSDLAQGSTQCRADRATSPETPEDATRLQSSGQPAALMMLPAAPDAYKHQDIQHTAAWQDWHRGLYGGHHQVTPCWKALLVTYSAMLYSHKRKY
jgi:hypothetical protein